MEKQNNIILAPSSSQVTELYKLWRENHGGAALGLLQVPDVSHGSA